MSNAVNFLLESGISLSLLAAVYFFFLRKETFFRLNRVFLLGSLLFSVVLPFMKFRIYNPQPVMLSEITVTPYQNLLQSVTVYGHDFTGSLEKAVLSSELLIWIYLAGVTFFLARFIFRVLQIQLLIRKNAIQKFDGFKVVLLDKECSPFSFMNTVFISRSLQNNEGYDRMMAHELEHIKQGHSLDVLILELLTVFQWFNPFMWILRRAIRENHEYLADQAVLNSGVKRGFYKKLLLNQFAGGQLVLTNNFNYSLIKNRIKMMSKIKSSKIANAKYILGLLTILTLVVVFACEQKEMSEIQTEEPESSELSVKVLDGKLMIEGESGDLEQLKNMFSDSENFDFETDSAGNLLLVKKEVVQPKTLSKDEQVFFVVENMPEYPGGEMALRNYIANNIKYPEVAQKNGISGKVYVTFVVSKDGSVANVKIARGVDPSLDKEALRVVNSLPKWKPGEQRGTKVNVSYTVPINFSLE